jgi:hypothetical protein
MQGRYLRILKMSISLLPLHLPSPLLIYLSSPFQQDLLLSFPLWIFTSAHAELCTP